MAFIRCKICLAVLAVSASLLVGLSQTLAADLLDADRASLRADGPTLVTFYGRDLREENGDELKLWTSFDAETEPVPIHAKDKNVICYRITPKQKILGNVALRLYGEKTVTQPILLSAVFGPDSESQPEYIEGTVAKLPFYWDAKTKGQGVHRIGLECQEGQLLVAEATSSSIGVDSDLMLILLDEAGKEVAFADDCPGDSDPTLMVKIPETGKYTLLLRDAEYRGGMRFHLRVASSPTKAQSLPAFVEVGKSATLKLKTIDGTLSALKVGEETTDGAFSQAGPRFVGHAATRAVVESVPFAVHENPTAKVILPAAISLNFDDASMAKIGFKLKKDEWLHVELHALNRSGPVELQLLDQEGNSAARWENPGVLPLRHRAIKDGEYKIVARDLLDSDDEGGVHIILRNDLSPARLKLDPGKKKNVKIHRQALQAGEVLELPLRIERNGFDGPVTVHVEIDGRVCEVEGGLQEKENEAHLKIPVEGTRPGCNLELLKIYGTAMEGDRQLLVPLDLKPEIAKEIRFSPILPAVVSNFIPLAITKPDPNAIASIQVYPSEFEIVGAREQLQLVVTGTTFSGQIVDLSSSSSYKPSGGLTVDSLGKVLPTADGKGQITVEHSGQSQVVDVEVRDFSKAQPVSFDYHALPILAQTGCSGGSCHGSPHGKAGFRLSLFGSDRELDRISLTQEFFGRRTNLIEPEKSLLLRKSTAQISHQGGKRLDFDGPHYKMLRDWIKQGAKTEHFGPACVGIQVYPSTGVLRKFPQAAQQFSVFASFDDGSQRDVTHLAKYECGDPKVAEVTQSGRVTAIQRGESAVIIRYLNFIETPLVTFVRDIPEFVWHAPEAANPVDQHVNAKLQKLQYLPAAKASDFDFLRRVYLDVMGTLPTESQIAAFTADANPEKRSQLIDQLLDRPESAKFWAQKWGDLLRVSTKLIGTSSAHKFNRWLEHSVATNQPYHEFAQEILLASGSTRLHPEGNFYRSAGDTSDAMETAAQVFLGTRIQCAKCHNHPFERWTQENYYGMSAFFNRLQRSKTNREQEVVLWSRDEGEVMHPATGEVANPWVPVAGKLKAEQADRREAFVDWLTGAENPLFAKIEVNRIWAHLLGRGIVEPFDDFRDSNPPANVELLAYLESEFVQSGFDRRHIMRLILN
ncbi:MAG: DUF1549 domain-containing protein, partial [Planctomycetota bacterium]